MSDIVPKNTLKEQPGKEMRIMEKGTVVQLKECIKILERYNQQNYGGSSLDTFHIHRERKHQPTPYRHNTATHLPNPTRGRPQKSGSHNPHTTRPPKEHAQRMQDIPQMCRTNLPKISYHTHHLPKMLPKKTFIVQERP